MLNAIRAFFEQHRPSGPESETPPSESGGGAAHDPVHVAACALLLELAYADDEFTADERAHIEEALQRHFAIPPEAVDELMALAEAERRRAVDLFQFTRLIVDRYDTGQKMVLAEIMWRVVYADGELAKHESYLMRKLSSLLELQPGYLAEARKRATTDGGGDGP